jgi:hypothetical protein
MKKIHITDDIAPKIGGVGSLQYQLLADGSGSLYVQIVKNTESGTFSPWKFPVAKYASRRSTGSLGQILGLDADGKEQQGRDNNDDAFLRAVLQHLLDDKASV